MLIEPQGIKLKSLVSKSPCEHWKLLGSQVLDKGSKSQVQSENTSTNYF